MRLNAEVNSGDEVQGTEVFTTSEMYMKNTVSSVGQPILMPQWELFSSIPSTHQLCLYDNEHHQETPQDDCASSASRG